jgi:hypothetical protein
VFSFFGIDGLWDYWTEGLWDYGILDYEIMDKRLIDKVLILCLLIFCPKVPKSILSKLFLIYQGAFTGYLFKVFVKRGEIIEAAIIAQLLDI